MIGQSCMENVQLGLNDIPETMLWTLHNRASVAGKLDGWLKDPKAVEIYEAIDYDYEKSFNKAEASHAVRSLMFDEAITDFWKDSPGGTVVNFAEGLETQRFRLADTEDKGTVWISVDLSSAIQAREKFIQPDDTHFHISASVLDTDAWMPLVPNDKPVYFTAQGLLMYLEEEENKNLFQKMAAKYPGATMQFDIIAKWLSNKTMKGWKLTPDYTTPKMPFGVNKFDAEGLFESWVPGIEIEEIPWHYEKFDGIMSYLYPVLMATPCVKGFQPSMVIRVKFPPK